MNSNNSTSPMDGSNNDAAAASSTPPTDAATASASTAAAASVASATTIDQHLAQTIQTLEQLTTIFNFPHHISKLAIDECGPEDVTICYNWILDNCGDEVQDGGGPVVPKRDCPHLDAHVRVQIIIDNEQKNGGNRKMLQFVNEDGEELTSLSLEFQRLCLEGNLMTSACQHDYYANKNGGRMRKRVSRKRLRSEDGLEKNDNDDNTVVGVGNLKCEEDYEQGDKTDKKKSCPGENWLCLQCGALLCSRYANGHAKMHYEDTKKETEEQEEQNQEIEIGVEGKMGDDAEAIMSESKSEGHCIAVSLADLSVWCYECNAYLEHPKLDVLTKYLEELKFGNNENEEEVDKEEDAACSSSGPVDNNDASMMSGAVAEAEEVTKSCVMEQEKINNGNDDGTESRGSMRNKRKNSAARKLPPEQLGTTSMIASESQNQEEDQVDESMSDDAKVKAKSNSDDDNDDSSSSSSSAMEHSTDDQAALIASLLQSEHGEAIRAYLARHESFDTSNLGQCVPMHMPKPPSFPDEMADFLNSPLCKSIIVLAGAGISVSSGIPDFRSAGVGLYDTLRPELLTASELERALIEDDPTLALDKGMFLQNPLPMLETKRSFILGTYEKKWKATLAHRFVEMLHTKLGKLTRVYTQNIDGLELQTALPKEKVVNVHGSMGAAACEQCGQDVDFDDFCSQVRSNVKDITGLDVDAPRESTPITCEACGNPTVKPTIVLFRGSMPNEFHVRTAQDLPECDLLIIMGTSLTVAPANSLVYRIPPTSLRMVMNNEKVGRRLGIDYSEESIRDVWAHGYTDETCLDLSEKMGWLDDLAAIVDELPNSSAKLLRDRLAERQNVEKSSGEESS